VLIAAACAVLVAGCGRSSPEEPGAPPVGIRREITGQWLFDAVLKGADEAGKSWMPR